MSILSNDLENINILNDIKTNIPKVIFSIIHNKRPYYSFTLPNTKGAVITHILISVDDSSWYYSNNDNKEHFNFKQIGKNTFKNIIHSLEIYKTQVSESISNVSDSPPCDFNLLKNINYRFNNFIENSDYVKTEDITRFLTNEGINSNLIPIKNTEEAVVYELTAKLNEQHFRTKLYTKVLNGYHSFFALENYFVPIKDKSKHSYSDSLPIIENIIKLIRQISKPNFFTNIELTSIFNAVK